MKSVIVLIAFYASITACFQINKHSYPIGPRSRIESALFSVENKLYVSTSDTSEKSSQLVDSFRLSLIAALDGEQQKLFDLMPQGISWKSPVVSSGSDLKDVLKQFSSFFKSPALTFFDVQYKESQATINYQLSFWYPMFWRPRIIIPGTISLKFSSDLNCIVDVMDVWDVTLFDILLKQLPPRWWDVFNSFSSPCPEYPPIKEIAKTGQVSFVELPATVAVEVRWSGPAEYPGPPSLIVPSFALFGTLRTSRCCPPTISTSTSSLHNS